MKQLTVLATALLLTTVAISFALWADVLKIQLVAYTGNVDVEFGSWSVREYVGFPTDYPTNGWWIFVPEGSNPEAKDVGQCKVTLEDIEDEERTGLGTPAGDNDLDLRIIIESGYPGYKCEVTFEVVNTGTIPVKLYFFNQSGYRLKLPATIIIRDPNAVTAAPAVTCTLDGKDGAQVHPRDSATYILSCVVEQKAKENAKYETQIYIQARQWNEPPSGGPTG